MQSAEETTAARDTLPDDLDFGGKTVNLFVDREMLIPEYNAEQDGDIVNDAIYERNNAVQERLNVTFNFIESDGLNANQKIFQGAVRSKRSRWSNRHMTLSPAMVYRCLMLCAGEKSVLQPA